jgi:hypothetical protein
MSREMLSVFLLMIPISAALGRHFLACGWGVGRHLV